MKEIFVAFFKPLMLFASGLYLLSFSFNGVNVLGNIDALIPFERVLCLVLGVALWVWFAFALKETKTVFYKQEEKKTL